MAGVYHFGAVLILALHLVWILWVVLGWLATRNRPWLRWLHLLSLSYGILLEVLFWTCPLTYAEQWLLRRAGRASYAESFLVHYLEAVIYPDISPLLLTGGSVAVCVLVLGIYLRRFSRRTSPGW